ncbi:MAG: hypothetical protein OXC08_13030 [Thiotrichales bacterium]|nr:hypothetical protein [Thiotrichales bacterium]
MIFNLPFAICAGWTDPDSEATCRPMQAHPGQVSGQSRVFPVDCMSSVDILSFFPNNDHVGIDISKQD